MEFPDLGANCAQPDCRQLDFLPAKCVHCSTTFCSEHLSPFVHNCQHYKNNILTDEDLASREKEKWQVRCTHPQCNVKDLVPMKCPKCSKHFCLSHRHADQHQCEVVAKEQEKKEESAKKAAETVQTAKELHMKVKEEINTRLEEAKGAGGAKGAMATKLALMKLKGRAKGDPAVPVSERLFFSVECPNKEQNPKPLDIWMSKVWTSGKAIDFMARQARIKNRNNIKDAPKLHIFKDELCISKPTDRTISELLNEGLIVDGDALQFKLIDESAEES